MKMLVRTMLTWEKCFGRGRLGIRCYSGSKSEDRPVGVWGACFDQGQPHPGVGSAPGLLRRAGLLETLKKLGTRVQDHGDIARDRSDAGSVSTVGLRMKEAGEFAKRVQTKVQHILEEDQVCVTLGGDHSIGTVCGRTFGCG